MPPRLRWIIGAVVALAGGWLTAVLSQAPLDNPASESAWLRLTVSGRPERIEHCRRLSDQELEAVPPHMRQRIQCEGRMATYRLVVAVDGRAVLGDSLRGGGIRQDRPIHLLQELPVTPGSHQVEVTLSRVEAIETDSAGSGADSLVAGVPTRNREERELAEHARARHEALPPSLELRTELELVAGEVALISYERDGRRLVVTRRARP